MKSLRFLLYIVLLAGVFSCESIEMVTYQARSDEAFFQSASYTLATPEDADSYTLTVSRANADGNVSVPVTISVENQDIARAFSGPDYVEFADGELMAEYEVSIDLTQLSFGVENSVTISLGNETDLMYSIEFELVVIRDYTWVDYATGTYTSGEDDWTVTMQHAVGSTLYRLYEWQGGEGYHLEFNWDGSGSTVTFNKVAENNGYTYFATGVTGSYGMYYYAIKDQKYDSGSQTFSFTCLTSIIYGSGYYDFSPDDPYKDTYKITSLVAD